MGKKLDSYSLGVVIDAKAADALKQLARVDAQAVATQKGFAGLESASTKSARGIGVAWRGLFAKSPFGNLNNSGKQSFGQLERDGQASAGRLRKMFSGIGAGSGGGLGIGAVAGVASAGTGFLLSAVTSGVGILGGALKDAATQGLDFNATLESAEISLKRMLGSAPAATAHINELMKAAGESPSSFESLLEIDQLLMNAGVSAKGLPKLLSDVAIGVGQLAGTKGLDERLQRVSVQIAQMSSLDQVQNEDLKILQENLIPAYDILAQSLGKTTKQVKELAAAGRLDGRAVSEILLRGLAETGQKAGDEVKKSYAVLRSNIDDAQQQLYAKGTRNLFQGSKDAMGLLLENTAIADKAAAAIDGATGKAIDFTKGVAAKIASGDFSSIGGAMISGVVEGVKGGAQALVDAGAGAANSVVKGFKDAAGIQSPSKVMQDEGKQLPLGVAAGISDPEALAAIERAVGQMMVLVETKTAEGVARTRKRIAEGLAKIPEIQAMLATIGKSEGAGYFTKVGGGTSSAAITGQKDRSNVKLSKTLSSTADGRYQFLNRTWDAVAGQLGLPDFSPQSQDLGAIRLMQQRGMISPLLRGDVSGALRAGNREWASLPGSPYGQHTNSDKKLTDFFFSVFGKTGSAPKAPQVSGFALSQAERFALYNPGVAAASKPAPGSIVVDDPGRTSATQLINLSASKPLGVTISDGTPIKVDVSAVAGSKVATSDAMGGLGIDTSKAVTAKASMFALERSAPTTNEARPGTDAELNKRATRGGGLFSNMGAQIDGPQVGIGEQATKAQGAAAGLKGAFSEVKKIGEDTLGQWSSGIGNMLQDWVLLGDVGPDALRKMTAQVLASASAESAVLAIIETAKGFAALASGNPVSASQHFTSAAIFGSVAVGTAIAGRALAGNRFNGKDNQQSATNRDVTREDYAGNNFRRTGAIETSIGRQTYQSDQATQQQLSLLSSINSKLQPVNGQQMVLATIANNTRAVARAAVEGVNGDFATGSRLGQRIAA